MFQKIISPFLYIFWMFQIRILLAFPLLVGSISVVSDNAAVSSKTWLQKFCFLLKKLPETMLKHYHSKREGYVILPRVGVPVTLRCTLNCDKCDAHIPDIVNPTDINVDRLIDELELFFSQVDYVSCMVFTGGEAFLHPHLDRILRFCAETNKVGNIRLQTNGTLLPTNKELFAVLKDKNITVMITDYGRHLQPNVDKLKNILLNKGIAFTHTGTAFWCDTGEFCKKQEGSAKRRYRTCTQRLFMTYFDGKLYPCCKSNISIEYGGLKDCDEDFISLNEVEPYKIAEYLKKLRKKPVLHSCSYCLGTTYNSPRIPVAVQRKKVGGHNE